MPRLNARETDPNPQITFIRALPLHVVLNGAKQRRLKLVQQVVLASSSSGGGGGGGSNGSSSSSVIQASIPSEQEALQLLKLLAAQVARIMKSRSMRVNVLEEYVYNTEFGGRNWNGGEVVELVLRRPDGRFWPMSWLIKVLCHELAHNEQMNHSPRHSALMAALEEDVKSLQASGHYGDGFWSSGVRLQDSALMRGEAKQIAATIPTHMCGGSGSSRKKRPNGRSPASDAARRVTRKQALVDGQASLRSGAQTAKKRKAGARSTTYFEGAEAMGSTVTGLRMPTVDELKSIRTKVAERKKHYRGLGFTIAKSEELAKGELSEMERKVLESSTTNKRAASKSARELRADAIEARLAKLSGKRPIDAVDDASGEEDAKPEIDELLESEDGEDDGEIEYIDVDEIDREARQAMDDEDDDGSGDAKDELRKLLNDLEEEQDSQGQGADGIAGGSSIKLAGSTIGMKAAASQPLRSEGSQASAAGQSSSSQVRKDVKPKDVTKQLQPSPLAPTPKPSIYTAPSRTWSCKACTFINDIDYGRCSICLAKPDGTLPNDV